MSPIDQIREMLRNVGLRSTAPRVVVLQYLHGATSPVTHADVSDALTPRGFDRTTVYRNLMALTEAGLISRTDLGDHVWRFELNRGHAAHTHDHPHFVCEDCGEVQCLHDTKVTIVNTNGDAAALPEISEITLKGRCTNCHK
ncbi:MAG TPA: Fur family transcriptional regulator [Pirellulales bacterium]